MRELSPAKQNIFRIEKVIKRDNKKALVKWVGYIDKQNSWVPFSDLINIWYSNTNSRKSRNNCSTWNPLKQICRRLLTDYKICRNAHLTLQIFAGLLGCGAVLVLVPVVRVFVAIAGALSAGISVVVGKAQLKEKESRYKACHRTLKQLLREVQMNKMWPDVGEREIIRETFSKLLELEERANYVVPFERYMKKYKLNGYYSKK